MRKIIIITLLVALLPFSAAFAESATLTLYAIVPPSPVLFNIDDNHWSISGDGFADFSIADMTYGNVISRSFSGKTEDLQSSYRGSALILTITAP